MKIVKVLYCRVSTLDQRTDRQRINEKDFDMVLEDKISGGVPFFEREGGKAVKNLIDKGVNLSLSVFTIDRLGRDLRDIINTIHFFTEKNIPIHFISQSLSTLDIEGKENPIAKMMISILGVVGEMERTQIRERQVEGIILAKLKGVYKGRVAGSKEDTAKFLSKPKNKQVLTYLRKGTHTNVDISTLTGVNVNTITKIRKLGIPQMAN